MQSTPVLLVEDDAIDAEAIARAFRRANIEHPLVALKDGESAVAYLAGHGEFGDRGRHPLPAFVLLDLRLPRMSGLEVLQWVRGQPGLRRLPIVVLTSSAERRDLVAAYEIGANSYLCKPVEGAALQAVAANAGRYWLTTNRPADLEP